MVGAFSNPGEIRMKSSRRQTLASLMAIGATPWLGPVARANVLFDLGNYRGQVVYLDFWASWCGPCLQSFPWLAKMHETYSEQDLRIVAINLDKDRKAADRFLKKVPAPFEIIFDPNGELAKKYKVSGMPHSFLFDRQGNALSNHIGFLGSEKKERQAAIVDALSAK